MKFTHQIRRTPTRNGGFSWGRFVRDQGPWLPPVVTYRLFRRDHRGLLHMHELGYQKGESRQRIAADVRAARHKLRDRVDEIDLAAMGIAA